MSPLVAVVGDAVLDVHVAPAQPLRPGGDVPATISLEPGGQGANVAVRLARRGVAVRLVCGLGQDAAGRIVRDALVADDVELDDLGAPATGTVVALLDPRGERTMLSQRVPLLDRLEPVSLAAADWIVVSGYVLLEDAAARVELGTGRTVVLGCSLADGVAAAWQAAAARLNPDLTVLNEDEAMALAGAMAPDDLSAALRERLGGLVVVTSPDGATAMVGSEPISVAAPRSEAAVDTTGAGDAFAATLLAELVGAPWPPDADRLRAALASASAAATEVTRITGAQAPIRGERGR
jgi:ribokinase